MDGIISMCVCKCGGPDVQHAEVPWTQDALVFGAVGR
jgi:hypothetical protein